MALRCRVANSRFRFSIFIYFILFYLFSYPPSLLTPLFFLFLFLFSSNLLPCLAVLFNSILLIDNPPHFSSVCGCTRRLLLVGYTLFRGWFTVTRSWPISFSFFFSLSFFVFGVYKASSFSLVRLDLVRCGGVLDCVGLSVPALPSRLPDLPFPTPCTYQ